MSNDAAAPTSGTKTGKKNAEENRERERKDTYCPLSSAARSTFLAWGCARARGEPVNKKWCQPHVVWVKESKGRGGVRPRPADAWKKAHKLKHTFSTLIALPPNSVPCSAATAASASSGVSIYIHEALLVTCLL
jgi:hypothetical protein